MVKIPLFHSLRRVLALAAFALGLAALVSPTLATPLITQGTWFEALSKDCTSASQCLLPFTAVPGGKTLIVRNVACRLIVPSTSYVIQYVYIKNSRGFSFLPAGAPQVPRTYFVNAEIYMPFIAASVPTVAFSVGATGSVLSMHCSLSGDLV